MQTQLPRRPYVELPPPPDGLLTAQREGSRRRTRRTVAAFTGGVSAVALVVVAVVLLSGGGGVAVLRPAPAPPATQLPSPGTVRTPPIAPGGGHAGAGVHPAQPGGRAGQSPLTSPRSSAGRAGSSAAGVRHASSTTVTVTRQPGRNPEAPNVCRSGFGSDNNSTHIGDDWCPAVAAVAVDGGVRLSYRLCRDSTTGGSLHFAGSREVEFTVTRNGSTVWRYSAHSANQDSPHTLTAAADDCWTWSLVWPGVTDAGAAAPRARYTLSATSTADELSSAQMYSTTFDY